jgi:serine/threonine-protein kinase
MHNHTLPLNFPLNNKYQIKKVLGQGGFGITYLAADTQLDIDVCIKELFISGNSTRGQNMTVLTQNLKDFSFSDFKERFIQEAKQLARFSNPGIVRVIEFFEANKTAYLVMEYVPGKNLKDYIAENGPMKETEALPLIHQLFDAVEEVHNAGMLHRDIKPDNILLGAKNRVVLIDFGSAREFTEGKTITQTAMLTPGFAPIEQYSNRAKRGTFTDIYALGATLYFLLTGKKPLAATDRYREQLAAPHQINPAVSEPLSSAVMMAMEMKEEDRFQHIGDFRAVMTMLEKGKKESPVKVDHSKKKSLTLGYAIKVFIVHLFFGIGFYYVDKSVKRKIIYPIIALYSWLSYINVFLQVSISLSYFHNSEGIGALSIFIGWIFVYVIGYIDVLFHIKNFKSKNN